MLNFDGLELILNFSTRVTQSSIVDRFRSFANEREKRISQLLFLYESAGLAALSAKRSVWYNI